MENLLENTIWEAFFMKSGFNAMSVFIVVLLCLVSLTNVVNAQPFDIDARSAILIDEATGTILYEQNIHDAFPPASITKIMTMLLSMEALNSNKISLEDEVLISKHASSMGGTQLYLEAGEIKTVEELMKGVAIRSANDASVAIAEYISGTEETFVKKMNKRAKELGMKNTSFFNTTGLPAEGHVTSAYDVSLMSRELLKHQEVHRWLTTWIDTVTVGRKGSVQELVNTNRLIRHYKGATGIKTGYTRASKHCLSASATRDSTTFIAVVMGSPTSAIRFSETAKLLDYGFANYQSIKIVNKSAKVGRVSINKGNLLEINAVASKNLSILVRKEDSNSIQKTVSLHEEVAAPIEAGDKIGEIIITLHGEEIGSIDIVAEVDVKKASFLNIISRMFEKFISH